MGSNFKFILLFNKFIHPFFLLGCIFVFSQCELTQTTNVNNKIEKKKFINPIDSISFNYKLDEEFSDIYYDERYGKIILIDSTNGFIFKSINSNNQLHEFDFKANKHSFSKSITNNSIKAYKLDTNLFYLLVDSIFYIKDYDLKTIDSFVYHPPVIINRHDIDFSIEDKSNLFKIKDFFVTIYYEVDKTQKGDDLYKNTDELFYFFNKDTSFFYGKNCLNENDTLFQYYRFPNVVSDNNYLYHTPKILNCISKTGAKSTMISKQIDSLKNNYLSLNYEDQFEISKLKKYRFTTYYNKELITNNNYLYLLREVLDSVYYVKGIREYNRSIEIIKFDKNLNKLNSFYVKIQYYNYALVINDKIYFFNFDKNIIYVYKI